MFRKIFGKNGLAIAVLISVAVLLLLAGCASNTGVENSGASTADPQRLMIPRWFLSSLTLDGKQVDVAEGQQRVTLQFEEGGQANGAGGCNNFRMTYSTGQDGKLAFGPIVSTKMACADWMDLESSYFQALSKTERFNTEDFQLKLSSADGKTVLVFHMPPK